MAKSRYPGVFVKGLSKTTKTLSQATRCSRFKPSISQNISIGRCRYAYLLGINKKLCLNERSVVFAVFLLICPRKTQSDKLFLEESGKTHSVDEKCVSCKISGQMTAFFKK